MKQEMFKYFYKRYMVTICGFVEFGRLVCAPLPIKIQSVSNSTIKKIPDPVINAKACLVHQGDHYIIIHVFQDLMSFITQHAICFVMQ